MANMTVVAHGIDIVEISRIARMLEEHGDRFAERCFTEAEQGYADSGSGRRAERYAVRFACKEAVLKALGTGWASGISWRDIGVERMPSGEPVILLNGKCAELAKEKGIDTWMVSLSHAGEYAVASVIGTASAGVVVDKSEN
ncbi:MAG TPA: holo-ACP synthase [Phycisphaerales bacterium]|nr:holo-ACP synthase [Phycisphaerales bacterium]